MDIVTYQGGELSIIWQQTIPMERQVPVAASECLRLDPSDPLPDFNEGVVYHVSVINEVGPSRHFSGDFCVIRERGERRVHQVRFDRTIGRRDWSPCRLEQTQAY